MKTVSAGFATHLTQETTNLATCWIITRRDGTQFFFTDHDRDIPFDGNLHVAETGYKRTAVQNDSSLSVDNLNIEGVFDSAEITVQDMRAGLFDFAEVRIFVVNWDDLAQGNLKMRRGRLGEVTLTAQGVFRTELRGLSQMLSQRIGEVYGPEDAADLGDSRSKVPIDPPVLLRSTAFAIGDFVRVATAGGTTQERYENRIYEAITAGTTGQNEPTFDTTVDNTTLDDIEATGVLTFSGGNALDTETVTLDVKTYTFNTILGSGDGDVLIGTTASDSIDNLVAAITLGAGSGTLYAAATTLHSTVTASAGVGDTMDVVAKTGGTGGNSIATTEGLTFGSFGGGTLSGGAAGVTFAARQAFMRHAVVATVVDRKEITLTITEARAVDDWFNGGAIEFEDGANTGRVIEIRDWTQTGSILVMFLPASFDVQVGDKVRVYSGFDKQLATAISKFIIPNSTKLANGNAKNFRGFPFIPGQDELLKYPDAK